MIKLIAQYESIVEGKIGRFFMDHDTPINIAEQMACEFLTYLGTVKAQAKAQADAAKAAENPVPEKVQEEAQPLQEV
jgi:hypothetical protein